MVEMKRIVNGEVVDIPAEEKKLIEESWAFEDAKNISEDSKHSYREARAQAYLKSLGYFREGTNLSEARFIIIGDILDAIIKHITGEDTTELTDIITKIKAVKAAHPKPTM